MAASEQHPGISSKADYFDCLYLCEKLLEVSRESANLQGCDRTAGKIDKNLNSRNLWMAKLVFHVMGDFLSFLQRVNTGEPNICKLSTQGDH